VIVKTDGQVILPLQIVAEGARLISGDIDVSTKLAVQFFINFGRRFFLAAGAGVRIRIEGTSQPSGDGYWAPLTEYLSDFVAAERNGLTGTVAAGQKVLTMASTANLLAQQIIFIDNPTILNSEWARIKSLVANVSVTIEDNLLNAQTGATISNKAEMWAPTLDVSAVKRLRLVVDGSLFTQAFAIRARMVSLDSIG
jgi:hypothetical protein